jgi:hypothetical protein
MAIAAKSWLPAELSGVQPYSMGPLLRDTAASCVGKWATPAVGTCVGMDRSELMISSCFVAPMEVQYDAQKRGQRGIIMFYPKGLLEALGLGETPPEPEVERTPRPFEVLRELSFMDSLADLEDED